MSSKILLRRLPGFLPISNKLVKKYGTGVAEPQYLGIQNRYTNDLKFVNKDSYEPIPIFRMMTNSGNVEGSIDQKLNKETLKKMYGDMVTLNVMDLILYESQRQGRISFYMTNSGEEAVQIGSAAGLTIEDMVYAQYREAGVLLWRGFKLSDFMNQCYGNCEDRGKGKQMPVHYGSKGHNFVTISSPLTTQLPQAVGAAYGQKLKKEKSCVACYFGEGAASEGDAHAAFNFSATLDCPVVFICRNNGYAISTPSTQQYKGDGIGARGPAYGINTIRVDGNDVFAVYHATQMARKFCIDEGKPVLLEAMTYRIGHHSTSDDSTAYRKAEEISMWQKYSPVAKLRQYLQNQGFWSDAEEIEFKKAKRSEILAALSEAEMKLKPNWREMFTDVYKDIPQHLQKQMESMEKHLEKYSEHYPLNQHKKT